MTAIAHEFVLVNRTVELMRLRVAVNEFALVQQLSEETVWALQLALEELVGNVICYAWPEMDGRHEFAIRFWIEDELHTEITDDGAAFDPLSQPCIQHQLPVEQRRIGGLGIHFVRSLIPNITYERRDGRNVLRLRQPLEKPACP